MPYIIYIYRFPYIYGIIIPNIFTGPGLPQLLLRVPLQGLCQRQKLPLRGQLAPKAQPTGKGCQNVALWCREFPTKWWKMMEKYGKMMETYGKMMEQYGKMGKTWESDGKSMGKCGNMRDMTRLVGWSTYEKGWFSTQAQVWRYNEVLKDLKGYW